MTVDTTELTAGETEALRRIDALLQRRFGGIAPGRRFDERVLERVREFDAVHLAARRAQAERQFARMTSMLAHQWRSARHALVAKLAAFTSAMLVTGVVVKDALPHTFAAISSPLLAQIGAPQLSWTLTAVALATTALGWGISTRVKL